MDSLEGIYKARPFSFTPKLRGFHETNGNKKGAVDGSPSLSINTIKTERHTGHAADARPPTGPGHSVRKSIPSHLHSFLSSLPLHPDYSFIFYSVCWSCSIHIVYGNDWTGSRVLIRFPPTIRPSALSVCSDGLTVERSIRFLLLMRRVNPVRMAQYKRAMAAVDIDLHFGSIQHWGGRKKIFNSFEFQ